jgi:Protein O-mannosyl-transferase TMEM260-like
MDRGASVKAPLKGAIAAGLGALALYIVTLAPTTAFWDTSEYIATAHILGIPHPPGNSLFVFLAKVWSMLLAPTGLSVAVRINLFAAATSAAATGFLYLVAHRVLTGIMSTERLALIGAGASALIGATAFTVWNQSNVNEKVYTLSVLIIAAVSWLAILWHDRKEEPGSERYLLIALFLMAIGSTSHMMSVLPLPAIGVLILLSGVRPLLKPPVIGRAVALVVLGLSFNFVLPIRAGLDPVVNEGDPVCESVVDAAVAIYSNGRKGCRPLGANLTREQYQTPPVSQRNAPFSAQMGTYMQYFGWQWSRGLDASPLPVPARLPFTILFLALGLAGLLTAFKTDRVIFSYLFVLAGTLTVGLVIYLNFKHGYSLHAELSQVQREVRERDYFFIAGFLVWGCLAGIGLAWMWHTLATGLGGGARKYKVTSPVFIVAFFPLLLNWGWASRAGDYAARDWAYDLLMSVEPYGVLFTNGDNDTFPLWYIQEVEGIRRDVTVIVGQYLYTSWYLKQLQELTLPANQRLYDPDLVPGLHVDRSPPRTPITRLSESVMDSVGRVRLAQDMTVAFPKLAVTYPAGMVLDRSQQLALRVINDSALERPIFFTSAGGLMQQLGLDRWGVRHGLTTKLELRNLDTDPNDGLIQGGTAYGASWFALDQSMKLYDEVYQFRGLRDRSIWPDRSTLMMPMQYYVMALQLSDVVALDGRDPAISARLRDDAAAFQLVGQGGLLGTPGLQPQ